MTIEIIKIICNTILLIFGVGCATFLIYKMIKTLL
jgi:hypothetical protein